MNSLSLDSSTELLCLCARKENVVVTHTLHHGLQHAPTLVPLIDRILADAGLTVSALDLIVCSIGPGSFTGIRIGLATAKGISFGSGCAVVGVSTLDAYALPYAALDADVYPVIDARKGNYYTALFRKGKRVGDYRDDPPEVLLQRLRESGHAVLAGPDALSILDRVTAGSTEEKGIDAAPYFDPRALLQIGEKRFAEEGADEASLVPLYLRKSEAEIAADREGAQ